MADPGEHAVASDANALRAQEYAAAFPADPAWEIVFIFYGVLHLVQAYLLSKGGRFTAENHGERDRAMRAATELRQAPADYRKLKSLSEQVRYDPGFKPRPQDHVNAASLARQIAAIIRPKLNHNLQAP